MDWDKITAEDLYGEFMAVGGHMFREYDWWFFIFSLIAVLLHSFVPLGGNIDSIKVSLLKKFCFIWNWKHFSVLKNYYID